MYSLTIIGLLIFIFSIKLPASLNIIFSAGIKIDYSAGKDCTWNIHSKNGYIGTVKRYEGLL